MRQSNIEALRIAAMLMVLAVHANFWSLGVPDLAAILAAPSSSLLRMTLESATLVCVNVFVMISGWFSIRPSLRGLSSFLFQCLFYSAGIYLAMIMLGRADANVAGLIDNVLLLGRNWFVGSYLVLYLLSPLLNRLICGVSVRMLAMIVALFYILQITVGWIYGCALFDDGYSPLSFAGLYLLAALMRRWNGIRHLRWLYPLGVAANVALMAVIARFGLRLSAEAYSNPLVVIASVGLFCTFAGLKMRQSQFVNKVAASAFAVYLIHMNPYIAPSFRAICIKIYDAVSGGLCIVAFAALILAVFAICVAADRIRLAVWRSLSGTVCQ